LKQLTNGRVHVFKDLVTGADCFDDLVHRPSGTLSPTYQRSSRWRCVKLRKYMYFRVIPCRVKFRAAIPTKNCVSPDTACLTRHGLHKGFQHKPFLFFTASLVPLVLLQMLYAIGEKTKCKNYKTSGGTPNSSD
jgi:hypothetical protein